MVSLHIPGPQVIRSECQEIRRAWTNSECKRRAENAARRQAEFLALLDEIESANRVVAPPVRSTNPLLVVASTSV